MSIKKRQRKLFLLCKRCKNEGISYPIVSGLVSRIVYEAWIRLQVVEKDTSSQADDGSKACAYDLPTAGKEEREG